MAERRITGPVNDPGRFTAFDFEFVSTAAIALATTVEIFSLAAGFDYTFVLEAFAPTDDTEVLWMRWSDDNSTFEAGASDYQWGLVQTVSFTEDVADNQIDLTVGVGNDANNTMSITVYLTNPNASSEQTTAFWNGFYMSVDATPSARPLHGGARFIQGTDTIQGVQFLWSGGSTFKAQGDITVWRRRRS